MRAVLSTQWITLCCQLLGSPSGGLANRLYPRRTAETNDNSCATISKSLTIAPRPPRLRMVKEAALHGTTHKSWPKSLYTPALLHLGPTDHGGSQHRGSTCPKTSKDARGIARYTRCVTIIRPGPSRACWTDFEPMSCPRGKRTDKKWIT